ncbi:hypothetical protein GCM10028895_24660 [Pontibacter rugosus]
MPQFQKTSAQEKGAGNNCRLTYKAQTGIQLSIKAVFPFELIVKYKAVAA